MDTSLAEEAAPIPVAFIQQDPGPTSIRFAGHYINLRRISRHLACDHGHLSRIFNSSRDPSMKMARRLAETLNMTLDAFLTALDVRKNRTKLQ